MKIILTLCTIGMAVLICNVMNSEAVIQIKCPEGTELRKTKNKICTCEPPAPLKEAGSLIFVLDSTNSMSPNIEAVKNHIKNLVTANKIFRNFVVSYYNDPYDKHVKVSTSAEEIVAFLGEILVGGGGDCPEPSMHAAIDALEAAHDNSILLLITDANPKDPALKDKLLTLLKQKRTRMYTVVTGDLCTKDPEKAPPIYNGEYTDLAQRTFGKVINVENPLETKKIMTYFERILQSKMSLEAFPNTKQELDNALAGKCICHFDNECVKIPPPPPPPTVTPPNPCKDTEIAVKKNCDCPTPKPPTQADMGSLIFVIDTTNSMDGIIAQVKDGVSATVAANKKFKNYVVLTYNDLDETDKALEDQIKTTSADAINRMLELVIADGGGNCPEPSMRAIMHAAQLADDNSILFLFTDATAKDYSKVNEVITVLKQKHVVPYIVVVGTMCKDAPEDNQYHQEYETLTNALGGKFIKFDNEKSVGKVMEFIQKAVAAHIDFHSIGVNEDELNKSLAGNCCKWECIPKEKCPEGSTLVSVTNWKTQTTTENCMCPNRLIIDLHGVCGHC